MFYDMGDRVLYTTAAEWATKRTEWLADRNNEGRKVYIVDAQTKWIILGGADYPVE